MTNRDYDASDMFEPREKEPIFSFNWVDTILLVLFGLFFGGILIKLI